MCDIIHHIIVLVLCLTTFWLHPAVAAVENHFFSVLPVDTVGCYGEISTMYCESERDDVIEMHWFINGATLTDELAQSRGLSTSNTCRTEVWYSSTANNRTCLLLLILGSDINNNTIFACAASFEANIPKVEFAPAGYTLLDVLPPVESLACIHDGNITSHCTWKEPFCKPVNYSYTVMWSSESDTLSSIASTQDTQFAVQNMMPCSNYTIAVSVKANTTEPSIPPSPASSVTVQSDISKNISICVLQDLTLISFKKNTTERTVNISYKSKVSSTLIHKCAKMHLLLVPEIHIGCLNNISKKPASIMIKEFFHSYNESTGIGNYTIGSFNKSFIGNYTLVLKKLSSIGPLELATIGISTFHVQKVDITQLSSGSTRIECGFAMNSYADGCSVLFIPYSSEPIFISKRSYDKCIATIAIDIPAGEYSVSVYDVVDGVTQSSTPAKMLLDIKIDTNGSRTNNNVDQPLISNSLYMGTPTISSSTNEAITPSITPPILTATETLDDWLKSLYVIMIVIVGLMIMLILMLIGMCLLKKSAACNRVKHSSQNLDSEIALTQSTGPSILPVVLQDVDRKFDYTHDNAGDGLNTMTLSMSTIPVNDKKKTTVVETAINDHDDCSRFPSTSTTHHQQDTHKLISLENMTQKQRDNYSQANDVPDSHNNDPDNNMAPDNDPSSKIIVEKVELLHQQSPNHDKNMPLLYHPHDAVLKKDAAPLSKLKVSCRPLVICWGDWPCIPQEVFPNLVNNILKCDDDDYKFKMRCRSSHKNSFQIKEVTGKISGIIELTKKVKWIEISVTTTNTKEDCPNIYKVVNNTITRTLRTLKHRTDHQPTVTTLCPLCPSFKEDDHLCKLSKDGTVKCSIEKNKTGHITEDISCWYQDSIPFPLSILHDSAVAD